MTLPIYHGNFSRCVKCGLPTLCATQYIGPFTRAGEVVYEEHLRRTCGNCGYSWKEACADADAE